MKHFDWKTKFKNRAFVATFVTTIVGTIYAILALFGITPALSQDSLTDVCIAIIMLIATGGVVMNPNTPGITDKQPKDDETEEIAHEG